MEVTRASDGRANLHIWREGGEYWCQKSAVFLKEWTNVQFTTRSQPAGNNVSYHDVRRSPLRFAANTFDAANVYHVFEHLTQAEGQRLVDELYRVLKPGGLCRISVPDLERICRDYLQQLERSLEDPSPKNLYRYHWSVWEIFDQMVREESGGNMLKALLQKDKDVEFIQERYGDVFREFYEKATPDPNPPAVHRNPIQKLLARPPSEIPAAIYRRVKRLLQTEKNDPQSTAERVKWMYDRVSLRMLLESHGFEKFSIKNHAESDIVGWERYDLDRSNYGDYGIDPSVYAEARKP